MRCGRPGYRFARTSGLTVLDELKSDCPRPPVLIMSMYEEEQYAIRVLKAGASGYLMKDSLPEELIKAIRKIASGGKYVSPALAEKLASELTSPTTPHHEALSDREFQILCLIASGKNTQGNRGVALYQREDREHVPGPVSWKRWA